MIDRVGRPTPRFPPACEPAVATAIDARLSSLNAGPADLAITQGACGTDLLFAEAMLERGAKVHLHLPFSEERFIEESVDFPKAASSMPVDWRARFLAVRHHASTQLTVMSAGSGAGSADVFERCNQWMLESSLAFGADKVRFICVWNGAGGDGPGGTEHMRRVVAQSGGAEFWIDTRQVCNPP